MPSGNNKDVIEVMQFLLKNFRFERMLYITFTSASVILLGYLVFNLTQEDNPDWMGIATLLAPSGVIGVTLMRILKMWSDCVELTKISMMRKMTEKDEE